MTTTPDSPPDLAAPHNGTRDLPPQVPHLRADLQILQSLRRIFRAADLYSHRLAHDHQVTGPQLMCLVQLCETGEMTLSALSKAIYLSPSTVVGIVDRLEARGLIERLRSSSDRRKTFLSPTDSGRKLVSEAPSPLQSALQRGLQDMSADQQQALVRTMDRLVEMLEIHEFDAAPMLETGDLTKSELLPTDSYTKDGTGK